MVIQLKIQLQEVDILCVSCPLADILNFAATSYQGGLPTCSRSAFKISWPALLSYQISKRCHCIFWQVPPKLVLKMYFLSAAAAAAERKSAKYKSVVQPYFHSSGCGISWTVGRWRSSFSQRDW